MYENKLSAQYTIEFADKLVTSYISYSYLRTVQKSLPV